jgi:hypothetical protein
VAGFPPICGLNIDWLGLGTQLPVGEMADSSEVDAVLEKFAKGRVMTTFHPW